MKRKIFPTLAAAAMAMTAGIAASRPAEAAAVVTSGSSITGVTGIDYNGMLYDATFAQGSCNTLFNQCNAATFTFRTLSDAFGIANALASSVNLAALVAGGDTLGSCSDTSSSCGILTPYANSGGNLSSVTTILNVTKSFMGARGFVEPSPTAQQIYATWTATPEPSSAALLAAAAVATAAATRRRKKRR